MMEGVHASLQAASREVPEFNASFIVPEFAERIFRRLSPGFFGLGYPLAAKMFFLQL